MRKIIAAALLCGFGLIPTATSEAKGPKATSSHAVHTTVHASVHPKIHTKSSFQHVVRGRHFRFDHCVVRGRDCYRYWWESRRCYVYWYPGATCYYTLADTGLVPVTGVATTGPATGLPMTGPALPATDPATGPALPGDDLPPLPTDVP